MRHHQSDWSSLEGVVTSLLDGNPIAILITAFIAFGLPVLLHLIFYQTVASPPVSNFLLLGPSGAGKTALVTLVSSFVHTDAHAHILTLFYDSLKRNRLYSSRSPRPHILLRRPPTPPLAFPFQFRLLPTASDR